MEFLRTIWEKFFDQLKIGRFQPRNLAMDHAADAAFGHKTPAIVLPATFTGRT
jgi:hypothetical protein